MTNKCNFSIISGICFLKFGLKQDQCVKKHGNTALIVGVQSGIRADMSQLRFNEE